MVYVSELTVTEFRAFKKAVQLLVRAGMTREQAESIMMGLSRKSFGHRLVEAADRAYSK